MRDSNSEYLMLREEINQKEVLINNTLNFFYAFMATYLAYALNKDDTVFLLLSYIMIIPAHLVVISKMEGMSRIGAYLRVFHEGKEFNWETRCLEYKRERGRKTFSFLNSSTFPFVFVNIGVFALLLYRTEWKMLHSGYEIVKIILGTGLFIYMCIVSIKNGNISTDKFVSKWEKIRVKNPN